jgi:plastocyanin
MKLSLLIGLVLCLTGSACTRPQPASVQTQPTITQPTPSPSPSPAVPVQLAGLVNNMGVKDFSGVGTNIAVEFQIKDFSFTPTFVKALPGTNVNIQLDNMGPAEHTFTIDSLKVDHKLAPGGQIEGQFKLPDSGIIPFYCRFHVGQGMQGAFYFQEGGAVAASPSPSPDEASASSGTRRRSASPSRRSSAQAPAGTAQNREGDLVVPDLVIGGVEAGKTTATTLPRALPAASPRSSPRPGSTAASKAAPQKAASGAAGEPSDPGTAGEEGEEGTPGEDGDTD